MRMPEGEEEKFSTELACDFDVVMEALVRVQAEKAECYSAVDRAMIFGAIKSSKGGFLAVNQRVKDHLRGWLLGAAMRS